MIDHVGLRVADLARAKRFYLAALAPLGYTLFREHGDHGIGLWSNGKPDLWLYKSGIATNPAPTHVCFTSPDRPTVDSFYAAALAAGGRDNGAPGLRPEYHPGYYGAFVLDPDGNNIEAVHHTRHG